MNERQCYLLVIVEVTRQAFTNVWGANNELATWKDEIRLERHI